MATRYYSTIPDRLDFDTTIDAGLNSFLSVFLSVCLFVCFFVCLPVCLFAFLPVCLSACLPFCLSACLLVCLSACLPVYLSACLPICLSACAQGIAPSEHMFAQMIDVLVTGWLREGVGLLVDARAWSAGEFARATKIERFSCAEYCQPQLAPAAPSCKMTPRRLLLTLSLSRTLSNV